MAATRQTPHAPCTGGRPFQTARTPGTLLFVPTKRRGTGPCDSETSFSREAQTSPKLPISCVFRQRGSERLVRKKGNMAEGWAGLREHSTGQPAMHADLGKETIRLQSCQLHQC